MRIQHSAAIGFAVSTLLLASASFAQGSIVLPAIAENLEGNDLSSRLFAASSTAGPGFRAQQIVRPTALSPDGVTVQVIDGIGYRPDVSNSIGAPLGGSFPDVVIKMSYTSVALDAISSTFANNITGTEVTVYDATVNGAVVVPPFDSSTAPIGPFFDITFPAPFVYDPTLGNLLIDITAVTVPSGTGVSITIDGSLPGGVCAEFGTTGPLSMPDPFAGVRLQCAGNSTTGQPGGRFVGLVPGDGWTIFARGIPAYLATSPFAMMIGFGALSTPLDLSVLGAPGNELLFNPAVIVPAPVVVSPVGGPTITQVLTLPADPFWEGQQINAQLAFIDIPANALGVVTSNGVRMHIGQIGGNATHPLNQVAASNATAATGFIRYTGGILGGAVLKVFGPTF